MAAYLIRVYPGGGEIDPELPDELVAPLDGLLEEAAVLVENTRGIRQVMLIVEVD